MVNISPAGSYEMWIWSKKKFRGIWFVWEKGIEAKVKFVAAQVQGQGLGCFAIFPQHVGSVM